MASFDAAINPLGGSKHMHVWGPDIPRRHRIFEEYRRTPARHDTQDQHRPGYLSTGAYRKLRSQFIECHSPH